MAWHTSSKSQFLYSDNVEIRNSHTKSYKFARCNTLYSIGLLCINFLIERCGKPELAREKAVSDDVGYKVIPMDRNNTMERVLDGLELLAEQYLGANLKEEVYEEAKRHFELKLKKAAEKPRGYK